MGLLAGLGCDGAPKTDPVGSVSAALDFSTPHDVTAVRFDVVAATGDCTATPVASQTVSVEAEPEPSSVSTSGSGMHSFADGLFVLPPGDYRLCATPLAGESSSQQCAPASVLATVVASQTNEVMMVSQCTGASSGGLDGVVTFNDPPRITALAISPSKFITVCQSAAITVTASDPDGDALSYAWAVVSPATGGSLSGTGPSATFASPGGAGDYVLSVTVTDVHGASTSLTFPVHVSAATCAVPDAVQGLFAARCSPCHLPGTSGGLHLDPATASYANLVGQHAAGAGCMSQVRVVPGDPAGSYIIAKLRGLPGICGMRMPRGLPPLVESDINVIENWIASLPH
ncbi:MAG TPA: PKD domain-containing protein [Polyangia bacterium]|nr:PKD domain-containing protein [Polyangia bacterium]